VKSLDKRPQLATTLLVLVVLFVASGDARAGARPAPPRPESLVAKIPPRPPGARTGGEFVDFVRGMSPARREQAILDEILSGNIPPFLRDLKPVELAGGDAHPRRAPKTSARVWVMPDYLAIGSDEDFVRFPASFETATAVARAFGFVLPTTTIVDAIYRQAEVRLSPLPMTPGPAMTSTEYFRAHDERIRAQLRGVRLGELTAGHKKDYVLTRRLAKAPSQEAIYGWHRAVGRPIQPLSLVHGVRYADYSHGVRLVSETVFVDGAGSSFYDLVATPEPARVLSAEGVIAEARDLMARGPSARAETK
jgi:hypothetical protein